MRRLSQDPGKVLAPYVRESMTVLEPGPCMGFFTLELARLVGPSGRVAAVDIQPPMSGDESDDEPQSFWEKKVCAL